MVTRVSGSRAQRKVACRSVSHGGAVHASRACLKTHTATAHVRPVPQGSPGAGRWSPRCWICTRRCRQSAGRTAAVAAAGAVGRAVQVGRGTRAARASEAAKAAHPQSRAAGHRRGRETAAVTAACSIAGGEGRASGGGDGVCGGLVPGAPEARMPSAGGKSWPVAAAGGG